MTYTGIWTSIETILNGLIGSTTLTAVNNYDAKTSQTFPYANISTRDGLEDFLDTCHNSITYKFLIRVIDRNKDVEIMEARMRLLCDNILEELRKKNNQTLWGSVLKFWPFSVVWGWFEWQEPSRTFEISVDITKIFNIN